MRSKVLAPLKKGKMGDFFIFIFHFLVVNVKSKWIFYVFSFLSFFFSDGYNPFAIFLIEDPVSLGNMLHYRSKMSCESWFDYSKGNICLQLVFAI